jgi:hypothetical protein
MDSMFEISIILIFGQSTKAADTVVLTLAGGLLMVIGLFGSASRVLGYREDVTVHHAGKAME